MKARYVEQHLQECAPGDWARIVVFTGARQTGKTTLVRKHYSSFPYLSIEDPVMRGQYARLSAAQWHGLYPIAILDEVQKEPTLVESVKSVYDQWDDARYILLGSSQLLLLEKVRESLAGRCEVKELFPLTLPELATDGWDEVVSDTPFQSMLRSGAVPPLLPSIMMHPRHDKILEAWRHYCAYGGYPALTERATTDDARRRWLSAYVRTYLERDGRDLAAMRDLEPFVKLQQYFANQTGEPLSVASVASDIGVSPKTANRYIRYLQMSYQAVLLPAWTRNKARRLAKAPKMHYLDHGVLQAVLHKSAPEPTVAEFESLVVAEMFKQARQCEAEAQFFHLRTSDGREVDLLVETPAGYFAFEIKKTGRAVKTDARHLVALQQLLDKPLLASFVLSSDPATRELAPGVTAVAAPLLLGA